MQSLRSIVVGIDFTTGCESALCQAVRIAGWNQARVRGVHVIDTLVATDLQQALPEPLTSIRRHLVEDAMKEWPGFAARVGGAAGVALDVQVNNRVRGILHAVTSASADLLVLGAYGSRQAEVGVGTIATACVRHAPCRVLLVRDTQRDSFKTIVACVDFSPTSLQALDDAARMAAQDSAALHVLHVFNPPWQQLHYRAPTYEADPHFRAQYEQTLQRRLQAFVEQLGAQHTYLKPTLSVFDYQGHRSGIVEYATSVGADLLVLGTRGKTNLRDVMLGSTAEKALAETRCSVLAVRPVGPTSSLGDDADSEAPEAGPIERAMM